MYYNKMSWQFLLTFFVQQCEKQGQIMTQMATHKKLMILPCSIYSRFLKVQVSFQGFFLNRIQDFLEGDQTKVNQ